MDFKRNTFVSLFYNICFAFCYFWLPYSKGGVYCQFVFAFVHDIIFESSFKKYSGGLCHKLLSWIGKNSMEVYILHVFFVMVFKKVGIFMMSLDSPITIVTFQIVYSFMLSLIAITLSVITSWFLKENKIIKLLLFGL